MHRLFEIAPELIEIFPFDGEDLNDDNVSLRKHSMQVMQSINDALGMADQPEELKETLIGLGVVHNMSNVQLESFAVSLHYKSTHFPRALETHSVCIIMLHCRVSPCLFFIYQI